MNMFKKTGKITIGNATFEVERCFSDSVSLLSVIRRSLSERVSLPLTKMPVTVYNNTDMSAQNSVEGL